MELRSRLGSVYVHLHQEQKAIEILQQVLAEDSNNVDANYWMGIAYQALGDFEKADHYVRKATTLAPKRVVRLYFTQQKYEEAIEDVTESPGRGFRQCGCKLLDWTGLSGTWKF